MAHPLEYKLEFATLNTNEWQLGKVMRSNTVTHDGVSWQLGMTKIAEADEFGVGKLQCSLQLVQCDPGMRPKLMRICISHQWSLPFRFEHSGDMSESTTFVCKLDEISLTIEELQYVEANKSDSD